MLWVKNNVVINSKNDIKRDFAFVGIHAKISKNIPPC